MNFAPRPLRPGPRRLPLPAGRPDLGHADPASGDYDITTQDEATVRECGLDRLKLGDFVAITDADNTFGRHYLKGAVTIGIIVHSDSVMSGHGPGVSTLLSSRNGILTPVLRKNANIADLLGIGRKRRTRK